MKKTKLLALASMLLVAGLVGCGGGNSTSTAAPESTPVSEEASAPVSEETSVPVSEEAPSGSYEATPALTSKLQERTEAIPETVPTSIVTFGDFQLDATGGKYAVDIGQNQSCSYNGASETFTVRLNWKSKNNVLYFTAAKAGKFVIFARCSNQNDAISGTLYNDAGNVESTVALTTPNGTDYAAVEGYEYTFSAAGEYSFEFNHAAHVYDFCVYYAA